jgi:hypothetical protein
MSTRGPGDDDDHQESRPSAPPPYGQPNYDYAPPVQYPPYYPPGYLPTANGGLILALGILSIVLVRLCGGIILGPIAWVMGNNALTAIDSGRANPTERGMVVAGRVCGIIGTILNLLIIAVLLVVFGLVGLAAYRQGSSKPLQPPAAVVGGHQNGSPGRHDNNQ